MKHIFLAASALTLIACGNASHTHDEALSDPVMNQHADKGIEVSAAYVMPPFPGRDTAAGFFEITNHGPDDRLISASSPISDAVEIHTHSDDGGVMKMRRIDGVDIAQGETLVFRPGSYHLMMFGAVIPEDAEDVALTLTYENAQPVTLIVPIGEPETASEGSHDKMHGSHGEHGSGH